MSKASSLTLAVVVALLSGCALGNDVDTAPSNPCIAPAYRTEFSGPNDPRPAWYVQEWNDYFERCGRPMDIPDEWVPDEPDYGYGGLEPDDQYGGCPGGVRSC